MTRTYIDEISAFVPANEQEACDQAALLWYIQRFGDGALHRENLIAHITSSGFILNPSRDRVLMVHHNIRSTWAWTGGHADGDSRLLAVAIREAKEETGAAMVVPLCDDIASIDILPVYRHHRHGRFVSAHLHLSVAFILLCDEQQPLRSKPDENTGVRWFDAADIQTPQFDAADAYLYGKLIHRAQQNAFKQTRNRHE